MGKVMHVCATCGEQFTRNTNAKRHNFNLHNNNGEIVSWTEYLVGRSNNRYQIPYRPPSRRGRYNSYRTTTATAATPAATTIVRDSMGDMFSQRPVSVQGQGQEQYQSYPHQQQYQTAKPRTTATTTTQTNPMSQYLALRDQLLQPQPLLDPTTTATTTTTKNSWGISSETLLKLAELKGLLYQHSYAFPNFDEVYQGAKHFAITQGDTTFLDEKLAFFRNFDAFNGSSNRPQSTVVQSNVVV